MEYRHFAMLVARMDENERMRACYTALAFNNPSALTETERRDSVVRDFDVNELLSACNGPNRL